MALTKGDKDWLGETINNSLLSFHTQVNEPVFNQILGDIKDLKQGVEELKAEVGYLGCQDKS